MNLPNSCLSILSPMTDWRDAGVGDGLEGQGGGMAEGRGGRLGSCGEVD